MSSPGGAIALGSRVRVARGPYAGAGLSGSAVAQMQNRTVIIVRDDGLGWRHPHALADFQAAVEGALAAGLCRPTDTFWVVLPGHLDPVGAPAAAAGFDPASWPAPCAACGAPSSVYRSALSVQVREHGCRGG